MPLTIRYISLLQIVAHASETLNCVGTCVGSELLRTLLPHLLEQLELCQKSLSAYLGAWDAGGRRNPAHGTLKHRHHRNGPIFATAYISLCPAETKRSEFPRFYFVSDPTLLEILSLGSDPPSVIPHFQSGLFDSLSNVVFDKVNLRAYSLFTMATTCLR